jgi:hypothetical protein
MTVLEIICGRGGTTSLHIVWRNPNSVRRLPRRHTLEPPSQGSHYILQEFVQDGRLSYWTTLSDLEVVAGGRAA